jgi:hypothetical protein
LSYQSQSEGHEFRAYRKAVKAKNQTERKLAPDMSKPKGMHRKTYDGLRERRGAALDVIFRHEEKIDRLLDALQANTERKLAEIDRKLGWSGRRL